MKGEETMEKNEVIAHVIMEQTADPCAVNVRDFNKNGMRKNPHTVLFVMFCMYLHLG